MFKSFVGIFFNTLLPLRCGNTVHKEISQFEGNLRKSVPAVRKDVLVETHKSGLNPVFGNNILVKITPV
jgi:hypothetical protein